MAGAALRSVVFQQKRLSTCRAVDHAAGRVNTDGVQTFLVKAQKCWLANLLSAMRKKEKHTDQQIS